ncbi:MAG: hypothetical protein QXG71_02755 [Nanopusillaceae archaeon]
MVGILEVGKMAFESYRKNIVAAIIFVLLHILVILVSTFLIAVALEGVYISLRVLRWTVPIIGAVVVAYVFPRVLGWYYNKAIGNINPNYKLSFKIWLIRLILIHLEILLFLHGTDYIISEVIPKAKQGCIYYASMIVLRILDSIYDISSILIAIVLLVVLIALELILYYPAYAAILGKIDKIEINSTIVERSLILIFYVLVWSIILGIIGAILRAIPVVGEILSLIYILFVFIPILNLIIAHKALSM